MEGTKETVVPRSPINESLHETVVPKFPMNELGAENIVVAAEPKTPPLNRPTIVLLNSPINTPDRLKVPKPFKYPERYTIFTLLFDICTIDIAVVL